MGTEERENSTSEPLEVGETAMFGDTRELQKEAARRPLPGETFGRYRIDRVVASGAMGSVYQAHDTQLNRKVALKIPKSTAQQDARFVVRFLREARSAATLSHPNICPVYDVGEIDGVHFITMAFIQGHPLSEFINPEKPQRDRTVANVVRKIALALHEAHSNGLIHRDVKPANVMIDHRSEPIIMDFGLARAIDDSEDARLTKDGTILGSPAYMSPEQIEGKSDNIGPSCDIYSLGVILYELLTGQLPFQGSVAAIIGQILASEPETPRKIRPDVHPVLADICLKAMSKRVEDRFASMKHLADALTAFVKSRETTAPEVPPRPTAPADGSEVPRGEPGGKKAGSDTDDGLALTAPKLEVTCSCGQRLVAAHRLAGKVVKCPRCEALVTLPPGNDPATRPPVTVTCRGCGQRFVARSELSGRVVKCTTCGRPLPVPEPGGAPAAARQIEVSCHCGQQFLAKVELAGKRVKCTSCGRPLTIPSSAGRSV